MEEITVFKHVINSEIKKSKFDIMENKEYRITLNDII